MDLTIHPDRDTFLKLAENYSVVPVWADVLADFETPVTAFLKLVGAEPGFLLESVEGGERWGRYSFIGRRPRVVLRSKGDAVQVEGSVPGWNPEPGADPLDALASLVGAFSSPALEALPPLHGGVVGYLGYDIVRHIERLPCTTIDDLGLPDMSMFLTEELVAFDHLLQKIQVVENVFLAGEEDPAAGYERATEKIARAVAELSRPISYEPSEASSVAEPEPADSNTTPEEYRDAVKAAKEYILAGDIFQVVISQRFSVPLSGHPFDVYRSLRLLNPSPYMYYIDTGELTLVGSSPEMLVRVRDGEVVTRPIAGTRRRGATPEEDAFLEADLLSDPKERAEHVMLVDLARNDIGRVVEFGTEQVDDLMVIERYSHVMHIVSSVSGRLVPGNDCIDVLKATFPAGTVTGAPKVRAMEIIDELEKTRRGPYAGVVGYFDFSGNMDTAITLRTMVAKDGVAYVQAGGGIVADSDPEAELKESENKAKAVLAAIASSRRLGAARIG